jgi:hypothetical protein
VALDVGEPDTWVVAVVAVISVVVRVAILAGVNIDGPYKILSPN